MPQGIESEPVLTRAAEPEALFWIVPENVPPASPLPKVNVDVPTPATLSIVPPPLSPPTPALKPLRSSSPPRFTAREPVLAPSAALLPNCSVPA